MIYVQNDRFDFHVQLIVWPGFVSFLEIQCIQRHRNTESFIVTERKNNLFLNQFELEIFVPILLYID